jgi:hypothetical protein
MSAAKRLARTEAYLETGMVRLVGATEQGSAPIEVALSTGTFRARRAKSCLVAPEAGDKVLCAFEAEEVYVLAVLAGREGAETKVSADGDLHLESRGGRVSVCSAKGVDVASSGAVGVTGAELHLRAKTGTVAVEEMGFFGRLLQAEIEKVALVAQEASSVVTRLSLRAKRVFRLVEEIDQTRAGTVDVRARSLLGLRAENAVLSARVLTKVDGEQIHIG